MIAAITPADVERFRAAVEKNIGLQFDDEKLGLLAEVLSRRLESAGGSASGYLDRLEQEPVKQEASALARELTVGETYFFRNVEQFHALTEVVLPELLAAQSTARTLSFLSAGCASGEEPFSLAIAVREQLTDPTWHISIRGVDLNPALLARAARARYSPWALRETTEETRRRWFRDEGREFALDEQIRASAQLDERNLAADDCELWHPAAYDVVFCRNVLMYFTRDAARELVGRITRGLAPGGYLFLGHAETLRGLSTDYHLLHTHGTFYYQRKKVEERWSPAPIVAPSASAALPLVALETVDWTTSWIEAVQRVSDRIGALGERSEGSGDKASRQGASTDARQTADLSLALELLGNERFREALDALAQMPNVSVGEDSMLLRAALLTHSGQLLTAQEACAALLRLNELSAGAHYLLALCREGLGDYAGAADHDQIAAYLDPTFAMPRLHMGLLARREGDHVTLRREFGDALLLLEREDAGRLLLFGGGFGREALIALCRAELAAERRAS